MSLLFDFNAYAVVFRFLIHFMWNAQKGTYTSKFIHNVAVSGLKLHTVSKVERNEILKKKK